MWKTDDVKQIVDLKKATRFKQFGLEMTRVLVESELYW